MNQTLATRDISEKELRNLYNMGAIKRLEPGEYLVKENDTDTPIFLFVEGGIKMVKQLSGKEKEVTRLHLDRGNDVISFFRENSWPVSMVASESSKVLAIEKTTFESLDNTTQLYFYQRLHRFDLDFINVLLESEVELTHKIDVFRKYLYTLHADSKQDYGKSDLILSILKKIPKLPVFTITLASDLMDDKISAKDVADMVKNDPSLAANVLKTLNSPYYNLGKDISDINHAIILLGFNELHQLVIAEGVNRSMPNSINFRNILSHSICISRIAFALSVASRCGKPAEISTIGLLHDLGESVKHLLKKQNPKIGILIDYIDASAVGALLLKSWSLPERVWRTLEFQNYPNFAPVSRIPAKLQSNVGVLYLAHLCDGFLRGDTDKEKKFPFLDEYNQMVNLKSLSVRQITQKYVLPYLVKNMQTLPLVIHKLIENHPQPYTNDL